MASYSCVTCSLLFLCEACKIVHLQQAKRKHIIIQHVPDNPLALQISAFKCDVHYKPFSHYCFTDDLPCCSDCLQQNNLALTEEDAKSARFSTRKVRVNHEGHFIKPMSEVLAQAEQDRYRINQEFADHDDRMQASANFFKEFAKIYQD